LKDMICFVTKKSNNIYIPQSFILKTRGLSLYLEYSLHLGQTRID
jgi:hypothetical protein